jgi:hypothetical protein
VKTAREGTAAARVAALYEEGRIKVEGAVVRDNLRSQVSMHCFKARSACDRSRRRERLSLAAQTQPCRKRLGSRDRTITTYHCRREEDLLAHYTVVSALVGP